MSIIKKIRIKNFKNLEDVEIEVKPLTFLFGPNGSGKSSFMKAMMFLQKNLFPLNIGKTIYKISDDVDLGNYKDIVTNNDESKEISFLINLVGEFDFPKIDVLKEDKSDFITDPDFKHIQYLDSLENENFFSVFEKLINTYGNERSGNSNLALLFNNHKFDVTISITFSNIEEGYNLKEYFVSDTIQSLAYKYIRKDLRKNLSKDAAHDDDLESKYSFEIFYFLKKEFGNISGLFRYHYGNINYIDDWDFGANDFLITPKFNLSKLHNLAEIKSDDFNSYRDKLGIIKIISEEWNGYSVDEKIKLYYEFLKFCYLTHRYIPNLLKSFLNYKHLPITREIPKKVYLLERNNFNPKEYYGILNILLVEFLQTRKEWERSVFYFIDNEDSFENLLDNIISTIEYLDRNKQNKESDFIINEEIEKEIQKDFNNENYKLDSANTCASMLHFKINNYMRNLGFNLFYNIVIEGDIGRIFLIGKNNLKMYMSNASSGLIQVFPIIVICSMMEKYFNVQSEDKKEQLKFFHNEFNDKYKDYDSIAYMGDQYTDIGIFLNFNTLLIEQPELHLHPKLQSQMAKIFSDTVKNSTDSHSMIIETHSEHLIRKIQVLIAKGELEREKVGVWYFDNSEGTTKIKQMEIEPNGFFKEPWPNGFFDESYNLSKELLFPNKN